VGRAAEAVDPQPARRRQLRPAEGAVADDPGTQQRGGLLVTEVVRYRIGEPLLHHHIFGVAAVDVPPGEPGPQTQVLLPGQAELADPAGVAQPRDTHPVSQREAGATGTVAVDDPDYLMPGDD
jgi:hypothetical protein